MKLLPVRELILGVCIIVGLVACGGEVDADSSDSAEPVGILVVSIQSPLAGAVVTEGDEVFLQLEVGYEDGESVDADSVSWSLESGAWSASGNGLTATDLPIGALQLVAEAQVGRFALSDSVSLTVEAVVVPPLDLSGSLDAMVKIADNSGNDFDDDCNGPVVFVLDGADLTGSGSCSAFNETLDFIITGTVSAGQVTGEMGVSDGEENVPYTGEWDKDNQVLTGVFDETWTSSDGSLRLWGTFRATVN